MTFVIRVMFLEEYYICVNSGHLGILYWFHWMPSLGLFYLQWHYKETSITIADVLLQIAGDGQRSAARPFRIRSITAFSIFHDMVMLSNPWWCSYWYEDLCLCNASAIVLSYSYFLRSMFGHGFDGFEFFMNQLRSLFFLTIGGGPIGRTSTNIKVIA